jgi:hypothetical protein
MIENLKMDNYFLGYPVGIVTIESVNYFDSELFFKQYRDFRLDDVFSKEIFSINRLILVDEKVFLTKPINLSNTRLPNFPTVKLHFKTATI